MEKQFFDFVILIHLLDPIRKIPINKPALGTMSLALKIYGDTTFILLNIIVLDPSSSRFR